MDWMIATDMAKSGHWTQQEVEKGIREASPALESRKAGHIELRQAHRGKGVGGAGGAAAPARAGAASAARGAKPMVGLFLRVAWEVCRSSERL